MLNADLQYFPCCNSFFTLVKAGKVDFRLHQPFVRSSFRNRMVLPGSNGLVNLSIPIVGGRNVKSKYIEVQIDNRTDWQRNHFRTIDTIYGKSPFYFAFRDEMNLIFQKKMVLLSDWNLYCLNWILDKCKLKIDYIIDNQFIIEDNSQSWNPQNHQFQDFKVELSYPQLFEDRIGFQSNVSILDLLFNMGPSYIKKITEQVKQH